MAILLRALPRAWGPALLAAAVAGLTGYGLGQLDRPATHAQQAELPRIGVHLEGDLASTTIGYLPVAMLDAVHGPGCDTAVAGTGVTGPGVPMVCVRLHGDPVILGYAQAGVLADAGR